MSKYYTFITLALCLFVSSCSPKFYYQICEVKSDLAKNQQGVYEFENDALKISYNFWCDGGDPGFTVTNKTDSILYVKLDNTYFIKNGVAKDYFKNRTFTTIKGLIISTATEEKSCISIPPHASKSISEYRIKTSKLLSCDFDITPNPQTTPCYEYTQNNTPVEFSNFITYSVGSETTNHSISNEFFISSITVYNEKDLIYRTEKECLGEKTIIENFRNSGADKFYILYTHDKVDTDKNSNKRVRRLKEYEDIYR